uniref:Sodium channel protein Nach n=1 Tax=Glossina austeni TaxID=7395 RepID=A0A1A9UF04_GLOAU
MVDIKTTSSAVWWIKYPQQQQQQQAEHTQSRAIRLCQDMTDLFSNISLHGYNKLFDSELLLYEKLIWLCLHITTFVVMIIILSFTWDYFVAQYFAINLHDPLYPVEKIAFPAISICSNNRISYQAAENYAIELSQKDASNNSKEYFMARIAYFSSLYSKYGRVNNIEELSNFQMFLDNYGIWDNDTFYNVLRTIHLLTPKCEEFLVKCWLDGKEIECFHKNHFQTGLTAYGPCCIFNTENAYRQRLHDQRFGRSDAGLTVILNSSQVNDVVSLLNMDAYVVIIHKASNFPDIASGEAIEVFPIHNEETFVAIKARVMNTSEKLRIFSSVYRKCLFDDETPKKDLLLHHSYSFANCITKCRIQSIKALCNCVPFYTPLEYLGNKDGSTLRAVDNWSGDICELVRGLYAYVPCIGVIIKFLNLICGIRIFAASAFQYFHLCDFEEIVPKHIHPIIISRVIKWRNVLTQTVTNVPGLESEAEEALYCPQCMLSCNDIQYQVSMMSLPTDRFWLQENSQYRRQYTLHSYGRFVGRSL